MRWQLRQRADKENVGYGYLILVAALVIWGAVMWSHRFAYVDLNDASAVVKKICEQSTGCLEAKGTYSEPNKKGVRMLRVSVRVMSGLDKSKEDEIIKGMTSDFNRMNGFPYADGYRRSVLISIIKPVATGDVKKKNSKNKTNDNPFK